MIALLPGYSHAMAGRHHRDSGAGPVAPNAGPDAPGYAGGSYNSTPISVPEPGSLLLVASGLTTLGGLLARRWYVTKKRENRPERDEP
jgi:hypothetical protein